MEDNQQSFNFDNTVSLAPSKETSSEYLRLKEKVPALIRNLIKNCNSEKELNIALKTYNIKRKGNSTYEVNGEVYELV